MRLSAVAAAAAAMASVCPASAGTRSTVARDAESAPAIRFGSPSNGGRLVRADLAAIQRGKLVLELAGESNRGSDVVIAIHLPVGAKILGMAVTLGGHRTAAAFTDERSALDHYRDTVRQVNDPALLEYGGSNGDEEFLLHVFPVTSKHHAIVEILLDAPGLTRVTDDWMNAVPAQMSVVGQGLSLYATGPVQPVPTVVIDGVGYGDEERSIDHRLIRRFIKRAEPRLANCWQHELFHAPALQGTVELHFTILPSGEVAGVSVDGTLDSDAAKRCMTEDVATWRFPATDGATRVNYPLTLVLPGD